MHAVPLQHPYPQAPPANMVHPSAGAARGFSTSRSSTADHEHLPVAATGPSAITAAGPASGADQPASQSKEGLQLGKSTTVIATPHASWYPSHVGTSIAHSRVTAPPNPTPLPGVDGGQYLAVNLLRVVPHPAVR